MRRLKDRSGRLGVCNKSAFMTGVMNALYPHRCRSCGQLFDPTAPIPDTAEEGSGRARWMKRTFDRMMRPWVCAACRAQFIPIGSPHCTVCGIPFDGAGVDHPCGRCLEERPAFNQARSVGLYAGSLMKLVHRLKYQRRMELARPLGRILLAARPLFEGDEGYDLIIPVPLHSRKMRQRGFNQAALLVSKGYPPSSARCVKQQGAIVATDLLKRVKHTPSLTGLNRKERRTVIRGAFVVTEPGRIKDQTILLIDDVCTTGATANECAKALKRHKARQVDLLTLARA